MVQAALAVCPLRYELQVSNPSLIGGKHMQPSHSSDLRKEVRTRPTVIS
jgi:hypothetical protein